MCLTLHCRGCLALPPGLCPGLLLQITALVPEGAGVLLCPHPSSPVGDVLSAYLRVPLCLVWDIFPVSGTLSNPAHVYVHTNLPQSCSTLCDPMDCSLAGSSVHGILQAKTLEWVAIPSSRGSS